MQEIFFNVPSYIYIYIFFFCLIKDVLLYKNCLVTCTIHNCYLANIEICI